MRLYATTTSERASKGQGGRELEIVITCEDGGQRPELARLQARETITDFELVDAITGEVLRRVLKLTRNK